MRASRTGGRISGMIINLVFFMLIVALNASANSWTNQPDAAREKMQP